jgi:methyl-accepting chemotaxis protein
MKVLGYNVKIFQQFLLLFLAFATLPSFFITITTIFSNDNSLKETTSEIENLQIKKLSSLKDQYSILIDNWIFEKSKTVEILTKNPLIRNELEFFSSTANSNTDFVNIEKLFTTWINLNSISSILLLNYTTGNIIFSKSEQNSNGTLSLNSIIVSYDGAKLKQSSSMEDDLIFFKEPYFDNSTNSFKIIFSRVIRPFSSNSGIPIGVLVAVINPNDMWDIIAPRNAENKPIGEFYQKIGLGGTGQIVLLDYDGIALSRSRYILNNQEFILKQNYSNLESFRNAKITGSIIGKTKNLEQKNVYSTFMYLGFHPISNDNRNSFVINKLKFDLDWILTIEIEEVEALSSIDSIQGQVNSTLEIIVIIIVIIGLIITSSAFVIANYYSKPIKNLFRINQSLAIGNIAVKAQQTKRTDEIGILLQSYCEMNKFLKVTLELITKKSIITDSSAEEMLSSCEEISASSKEVGVISQQISRGAQQQSNSLKTSMDILDELQMIISDKITNILEVSNLIERISSKITLIALNSGIEADRAGDKGKGFKIVSNNIRGLADGTRNSVKMIDSLINEISNSITTSMLTLTKSFTTLVSLVEKTASESEQASSMTLEQSTQIEKLTNSAQILSVVSQKLDELVKKFKMV